MSAQWDYLISLYHCGVRGIAPPDPPENLDWEAFAALAERQAVTPVVFNALRKLDCVPAQIRQKMHMESLELSLQNRTRQEAALDVLEQLRAAGLTAAVLKGMSVARYFAAPETRICADTDILISPEREQDAIALFGRLGFTVTPREADLHHFRADHPVAGLFEVHIRFWESEATFAFGDGEYPLDDVDLSEASMFGRTFLVLPPKDALEYLCIHRIKHFYQHEEGLRSAYDAALFFAENRNNLQYEAFWNGLRKWNADIYFNTLLSVFVRAGCFRENDFPGMILQGEEKCSLFSSDTEQYSVETPLPPFADRDAWINYTRAQAELLGGSVKENFDNRRRSRKRALLFPAADQLSVHYPALRKCRLLYPVFWTHRCASCIFSKERRKTLRYLWPNRKNLASVKAEKGTRTALMQELGFFRE